MPGDGSRFQRVRRKYSTTSLTERRPSPRSARSMSLRARSSSVGQPPARELRPTHSAQPSFVKVGPLLPLPLPVFDGALPPAHALDIGDLFASESPVVVLASQGFSPRSASAALASDVQQWPRSFAQPCT
jgi:hypothetical protein